MIIIIHQLIIVTHHSNNYVDIATVKDGQVRTYLTNMIQKAPVSLNEKFKGANPLV
jgi:hypothetical protein